MEKEAICSLMDAFDYLVHDTIIQLAAYYHVIESVWARAVKWLKRLSIKCTTQIEGTVGQTPDWSPACCLARSPRLRRLTSVSKLNESTNIIFLSGNGILSLRLVLWRATPIVIMAAINSRCSASSVDPIKAWVKREFQMYEKRRALLDISVLPEDSEKKFWNFLFSSQLIVSLWSTLSIRSS